MQVETPAPRKLASSCAWSLAWKPAQPRVQGPRSTCGPHGGIPRGGGVRTMFVVVGDALVDMVGQRGGRSFEAHPGGSPANVALGLARLGAGVTLITRLGGDAFGQMITLYLEASGVVVDPGPDRRGLRPERAARAAGPLDPRATKHRGDRGAFGCGQSERRG